MESNATGAGLGDPGEDFEQSGFTRAIAADDPKDLALLDLEGNVFERPELLDAGGAEIRLAGGELAGLVEE